MEDPKDPSFLHHQLFLQKGGRTAVELDVQDELYIPIDLVDKIEVSSVAFGGRFRTVTVEALENVFFYPGDLILTPKDREFREYRDGLRTFLEYRAGLRDQYEELA